MTIHPHRQTLPASRTLAEQRLLDTERKRRSRARQRAAAGMPPNDVQLAIADPAFAASEVSAQFADEQLPGIGCVQPGTDPDWWFNLAYREHAKSICRRCPVLKACARFALETRQPAGVWGGVDEDERAALIRKQRRYTRVQAAQASRTSSTSSTTSAKSGSGVRLRLVRLAGAEPTPTAPARPDRQPAGQGPTKKASTP